MAIASVEIRSIARNDKSSGAIYGPVLRQESLTISGSTATLATGVSAAEIKNGAEIFRLAADTDCYYAKGITPDPTATTPTPLTTARALLSGGNEIPLMLGVGDKVAVKSTA